MMGRDLLPVALTLIDQDIADRNTALTMLMVNRKRLVDAALKGQDIQEAFRDIGFPDEVGNQFWECAADTLEEKQQTGIWPNWGDSPNGFDGPTGAE
jgi:hypothetical protein